MTRKQWRFGRLEINWNRPSKKRLEAAVYGFKSRASILVQDGYVINGAYWIEYVDGGRAVTIRENPGAGKIPLLAVLPKDMQGDYNTILWAFDEWYKKLPFFRRWWYSRCVPVEEAIPPLVSRYTDDDDDDIPF
jgi:hypothetical protein